MQVVESFEIGSRGWRGQRLTPSRFKLSSLWRGTTVTSSISQRKATSIGVKPGCKGNAMMVGILCFVRAERDLEDAMKFMPQNQG
jgi:hypothetical protein